jgi:hypothetical protein
MQTNYACALGSVDKDFYKYAFCQFLKNLDNLNSFFIR